MQNFLTFAALLISIYILVRILGLSDLKDIVLASFCFAAGFISIWGYVLSAAGQLGKLPYWLCISLATVAVLGGIAYVRKVRLRPGRMKFSIQAVKSWASQLFDSQGAFTHIILYILAVFSITAGVINLLLVVAIAPHNWDSMTSHLPRMAQYLQHNNLGYFDADYWAQVVHPKGSTLLFLFLFLVSGKNENLTQLAQYLSFWIVVVAVYGISRRLGWGKPQSVFAALVASLLISSLTQASTNLNDMIIAACFGAAVYFLFTFRDTGLRKYLTLASLGIGLALGVKASSFSVLPSLFLVALLTNWAPGHRDRLARNFLFFLASVLIAACIFALPSGYVDNVRLFGNFLGNQDVREIHSFAGQALVDVLQGGTYNVFRYSMDFLSFDGLLPVQPVLQAQHLLRFLPLKIFSWVGFDLSNPVAINFFPFEIDRAPSTSEFAYWGVLGFGLVWIVAAWFLLHSLKSPDKFVLAAAGVVFLILVAFSGPYDSSRGRYFSIGAVFVLPLLGICLDTRQRIFQIYLAGVVMLGGVSAVSAVILKTTPMSANYSSLVHQNIFSLDRIGQLTFNDFRYYGPLTRFENRVPQDAKVAVFFYPNTFEYPLYGRKLTRVIIPINTFHKGLQPIPVEAQYLLYANGYPCPLPGDIYLGVDWYLRKLTDDNRECSFALAPHPWIKPALRSNPI